MLLEVLEQEREDKTPDYIAMQYLEKILNMARSSKGMPSGNPDGSIGKYMHT